MSESNDTNLEIECDVVVVGAGASGVMAASTLLQHQPALKVRLVEARSIPGGRVHSLQSLSHMHQLPYCLEGGAEWVHGESLPRGPSLLFDAIAGHPSNPLIEYQVEGGHCVKQHYHLGNGKLVEYPPYWDGDLDKIEDFIDTLWKYPSKSKKKSGKASNDSGSRGTAADDSQAPIDVRIAPATERSAADYFYKEVIKIPDGRMWSNHHILDAWLGSDYGTSVERLGMTSLGVSENLWRVGERDFLLRGGHSYWQTLVDVFGWEPILQHLLRYDACVEEIDYSNPDIIVKVKNMLSTCRADDYVFYTCKHVIVTVPLTMLKQRRIRFLPELPLTTTAAIDRLGMDAGMKIFVGFSECFWGESVCEITLRNTTAFVWDAGMFKDDRRVAVRRSRGTNKGKKSSAEDGAPRAKSVLVFMITGVTGEEMSALSDNDKVARLLAELDALYSGAASRYFDPSLVHIQDWTKEPFIEGCYSYPAPGTYRSATDNDRVDLSKAVANRLWFAGEAAALYHPATVLGAIESGKRAAEEIIKLIV